MDRKIPQPIVSIVADHISSVETHASLNSLFFYADAPGDAPEGSKHVKALEWIRRINKECDDPLSVLGKLLEGYMESEIPNASRYRSLFGIEDEQPAFKEQVNKALAKYDFSYLIGGYIASGGSKPSVSLQ